jgi:hypothetical protein
VVGNKSGVVPSEIARGTTYWAILSVGSDSGYHKTCADFACNIDFDGSETRVDEFGSVEAVVNKRLKGGAVWRAVRRKRGQRTAELDACRVVSGSG